MDRLAGYSSDTESEQFDKSSPNVTNIENSSDTLTTNVDLAAEWESFEKLIAGNDGKDDKKDAGPVPVGVPSPATVPGSPGKKDSVSLVENGRRQDGELEPERSKKSLKDHDRKRSLPTDSSESGSDLESDDSSDDSSDSSEDSSASDEPQRKKPRHSSKSKTPESSTTEEETDEESSEDESDESDDTSAEEDKQKKSSTDEDNALPTKQDEIKKSPVSRSRRVAETSSKHKRSRSRTRRSRSRDRRKSYYDRKKHEHSRNRKHHRQHSRHRAHRSRSRDRRHRSRSRTRSHRHRRSRSVERRKRSSRHHSRSRSKDRQSRTRRHSRDRKQTRRSPPYAKPSHRKPLTYKEVLRQKLIEAQHQAAEGKLEFDPSRGKDLMSTNEKPSPLPLMSINPLMSLATGPPGGEKVTPQQALMQTMAAMHQKAQELTGVAVPKYYNPAAVNPLKFAEQVKKRKLLWSKKDTKAEADAAEAAHQAALDKAAKEEQSSSKSCSSQWKSTAFLEDKDGRMAAKFRKLMGIKDSESTDPNEDPATEETIKKQQELFNQLDREYQFARMTTHTHRGIGLGFTSQMYPDMK